MQMQVAADDAIAAVCQRISDTSLPGEMSGPPTTLPDFARHMSVTRTVLQEAASAEEQVRAVEAEG